MALRGEILRPGAYAAMPSCILSSKLLQPSDKLVYASILSHLGKNKSAWPTIDTIMEETALSSAHRPVFHQAIERDWVNHGQQRIHGSSEHIRFRESRKGSGDCQRCWKYSPPIRSDGQCNACTLTTSTIFLYAG